uniref:Uncharacterized protein n=1 Tax=Leersia perrieri TaxID=77586 RepID=A0A0D9XSW9_9ORYZ
MDRGKKVSWANSRARGARSRVADFDEMSCDADDEECLPDKDTTDEEGGEEEDGRQGWGATSRSSVKHTAGVIAKFDDTKRQLVRDAGFGGLLELHQINALNRRFTVWLMSRLDWRKSSLPVGRNLEVEISPRSGVVSPTGEDL